MNGCSLVWKRHGLKPWIEAARKRLHHNVLTIAHANRLARIPWSVLARGRAFEARKMGQAVNQSASISYSTQTATEAEK